MEYVSVAAMFLSLCLVAIVLELVEEVYIPWIGRVRIRRNKRRRGSS